MPRVVMRLGLVVAIQLAVAVLLVLAAPRVLSALSGSLLETPGRVLAAHIESRGAARAELAGALAATLPEDAESTDSRGAPAAVLTTGKSEDAPLAGWPAEWPAALEGLVREWLASGAADGAPAWCMLNQGEGLWAIGAAPRETEGGWVVVCEDDGPGLSQWATDRAGVLSFALRPAEDVPPPEPPTLAGVLSGALEGSAVVPGLVGDAVVATFTVDTDSASLLLRAFGAILGASVLLIAGVQALSFSATYFQAMQPVKDIVESLEAYVSTGEWSPPTMRFREPQTAVDAVTRALEAQRQAEAEALELAGQLRAFLDALPAAAAIKDAGLRLSMVNSELARLAGRDPEELIGKTDLEIYPEDLARQYAHHDRQVMESGESLQFEEELETPEGERRTYRTFRAPVLDGRGQASGLVSLAVDITGEREMQARLMEAQKAQLMGRLAGGVAHIFNNVLTAVIGSTELALLSLNDGHAAREDLVEVKEAAERGARVSRQLLYLGWRQRSGDGPASIAAVAADLVPVLREVAGPGIEIVTEVDAGVPDVLVDAGELRQVILHLALNAIEAMAEGGTVRIECCAVVPPHAALMVEPSLKDRPVVLVRVQDSGQGIDSEARDHLFEPFFTTKGAAGGRGLGLPVAQSIVRSHQGAILFHSQPDSGAVFEVYLPSRAVGQGDKDALPAASNCDATGREVILLAEDEPSVRELTERMLASQGYTLWSAGRGDEALDLVESRGAPPDLLLSDVLMPGMNGVELALALRERYPDMPVLLMSGYVGESDDDDLKGFPLLWKPFTLDSLTKRVRGLLDDGEG